MLKEGTSRLFGAERQTPLRTDIRGFGTSPDNGVCLVVGQTPSLVDSLGAKTSVNDGVCPKATTEGKRLAAGNLGDGIDGGSHVLLRVEPTEAEAHDAPLLGSERTVHERCAVGAGAGCYAKGLGQHV